MPLRFTDLEENLSLQVLFVWKFVLSPFTWSLFINPRLNIRNTLLGELNRIINFLKIFFLLGLILFILYIYPLQHPKSPSCYVTRHSTLAGHLVMFSTIYHVRQNAHVHYLLYCIQEKSIHLKTCCKRQ